MYIAAAKRLTHRGARKMADLAIGRAEDAGRDPELREGFDLVTARSFARPAVTAEIGAGLVRPGGVMVVSEPPTSEAGTS